MLADMAVELMAAKSLLYRVCWEAARGGLDRKQLHAEASAVKLVCSRDRRARIADRAVQIFGGRGYMREQAGRAHVARAARRPHLGGHVARSSGW